MGKVFSGIGVSLDVNFKLPVNSVKTLLVQELFPIVEMTESEGMNQ